MPTDQTDESERLGDSDNLALWQSFVNPSSDNDFYQSWLSLLCKQIDEIKTGVLLLQFGDTKTFSPVAIWPLGRKELTHFGSIAQRALTEGRGIIESDNESHTQLLAYPIKVEERLIGVVVVEADTDIEPGHANIQRALYWNTGWLHDQFHRRELFSCNERSDKVTSIMEAVATSLRFDSLKQSLFELVNHISSTMKCARVAIGLEDAEHIRLHALSNAAWFESNTKIIKSYVSAMEETYDMSATIVVQSKDNYDEQQHSTESAHQCLMNDSGAKSIVSVPLLLKSKCIGVLTLERDHESAFSKDEIDWAETLATLLPAIITQKKQSEKGFVTLLYDDTRKFLNRIFGPRHLIWKLSSSLILITIIVLSAVQIDYRVTAKTVIEGEVQRAAVSPFEGYIASSNVRAGDIVYEGQVLCELDNRDLDLERHKRTSERNQQALKLRVAMASHDLTEIQALSAQLRQAEAQLGLVTERLSRAKLTAPFNGVVVSGDLHQLIGSPVEQGKKLFEIAPLDSYRVILQVDETEVRNIQIGQSGMLLITGMAAEPISFNIINTTPVATAQDGKNFFRIEARLQSKSTRLRPGMEGIGKVSVGKRRLWWIMTHSFTDWLRVSLWKWLP